VTTARCLATQADDARRVDAPALLGLVPTTAAPAAALATQRQALRLALSAHADLTTPAENLEAALQTDAGLQWAERHPALHAIATRDAADDLTRDAATLHADVDALGDGLDALLSAIEPDVLAPKARWFVRAQRALVVVGMLALGTVALQQAGRSLRTDRAAGAAWQASSAADGYAREGRGFHPIEGRFNIFFQTAVESEPWVRFDLGAPQTVRTVWVQNRLDNFQDWAVPLAVEISLDGTTWREVARRVEPFYFWQASFRPTTARWVRLRVPRPTSLQLGRVEIR